MSRITLTRQQLDVLFGIARLSERDDPYVMFKRTLEMMINTPSHSAAAAVGSSDRSPEVNQMLRSRDGSEAGVVLPQNAVIEISSEDEQSNSSSSSFEDEHSDANSVASIVSSTTHHSHSNSDSEHDADHISAQPRSLTHELLEVGPHQMEPSVRRKRKHNEEEDESSDFDSDPS